MLTDQEKKILALALDPAAASGEIHNCAVKLIAAWRKRKLVIEDFELNGAQAAKPDTGIDYGAWILPFGKYKGQAIEDCPRSYLSWLLGWMCETPEKRKKFADLIEAIEHFLNQ
jgi:hypothetical protein